MTREGSVYRRCTTCGATVSGKTRDGRDRTDVHVESGCVGTDSTWSFRVDVSAPGAPRRQRRGGGFATKREALDAMADVQADYRRGTAVEPSKLTVSQFLGGWLEATKPTKAPATHATRRHHVAYIERTGIREIPIQLLTEQDVKAMCARLAESGKVRGGGLSLRSIADIATTLVTALNEAMSERLVTRNVASIAAKDWLKAARKRSSTHASANDGGVFAWDTRELSAWLEVVAEDELAAYWRFAAMSGARPGECRAVRDRDIDLAAGTVTIARAAARDHGGGLVYGDPKSKRGFRTIELDADTIEVLRDARNARTVVSFGDAGSGLAFTLPDGSPITPYGLRARFATTIKRAGVPRITPHGLRHTHASLLLLAGVPLHVVSRRLGHSSEAFTAKTYAHVLNGQGAEAATRLADLVRKEAQ